MTFRSYKDDDYICHAWFERDRQSLSLETPRGRVIFELWDEAVTEAIQDGFLCSPRFFEFNSDKAWQPYAVAYAKQMGLIK